MGPEGSGCQAKQPRLYLWAMGSQGGSLGRGGAMWCVRKRRGGGMVGGERTSVPGGTAVPGGPSGASQASWCRDAKVQGCPGGRVGGARPRLTCWACCSSSMRSRSTWLSNSRLCLRICLRTFSTAACSASRWPALSASLAFWPGSCCSALYSVASSSWIFCVAQITQTVGGHKWVDSRSQHHGQDPAARVGRARAGRAAAGTEQSGQ